MTRIAIVGMACRYPDATSPHQLWENAISGRRAFRRLPDERMRLEDYWDPDPTAPDRFYARHAAVIEGYEFDRLAYKVAGSTYRSTDLTHWLALDTAARALADAGFPMAEGLPRERTGVIVGNSLTGEFTRASLMRLRWPYVRRTVAAALQGEGWDDEHLNSFLDAFESRYKAPFAPIDEDSLAGGLSNTIAGRICNYFDLKGGGYTVDGACSSSLLSVATACKSLVDHDVDVAVAGGVDLSIDPFEIIGFAKAGALATGEMKVYDRGSNGFWPGEGCGMIVLMREDEAREAGHRVYSTVAGWGISSDGHGGITRPEVDGYRLALQRAYERAGFGIETVSSFEGHGTGTKVGDTTELRALAQARTAADPDAAPAAIGSIKGMIGHTKAAAGVAGLIKTAMAVHRQVIPPALGCSDPHEVFEDDGFSLRIARRAEPWPSGAPVRAGITAMGFGGINTHVVLENTAPQRRKTWDTRTAVLASSIQDMELLLVDGGSLPELRERVAGLIEFVPKVAFAQLADLASTLHGQLRGLPFRAAVVASSPDDAQQRFQQLVEAIDAGETRLFPADGRTLLGQVSGPGRIGLLFPGQGSGTGTSGGALRRRFDEVESVYAEAGLPEGGDMVATEVAQPRIVTGSMAGLRALSLLGLEGRVAVGHSLGELSALHWAGAMDEETLLRVAGVRGRTMAEHSESGTMASIAAAAEEVTQVLQEPSVVIAGYNGPNQTVVAGPVDAVEQFCERATEKGLGASRISVSHAFHSELVAPAAAAFGESLSGETFGPIARRVVSTVTGEPLAPDTDVAGLLRRQITDPVLFGQAVALAAKDVDLFVEVGPGHVLSGLAAAATDVPAVALDTDDESLVGLLRVIGAAYVVGAVHVDPTLFHGRAIRPLQLDQRFAFFASPCEEAPSITTAGGTGAGAVAAVAEPDAAVDAKPPAASAAKGAEAGADDGAAEADGSGEGESTMEILRRFAAQRAELPVEMVHSESKLLDDLHLSSITVGQVVNQAAQQLGILASETPTNFASATVAELADALSTLADTAHPDDAAPMVVAGAAGWARPWVVDLDELPVPARPASEKSGSWRVYAGGDHPLAEPLRHALESGDLGTGVLVCLPENCSEEDITYALHGAKAALEAEAGERFVLVQHGRGAAGLAKTLRLEAPQLRTTIVHVPANPDAVDWVVAEVAATATYVEAYYDTEGVRRIPTLRALPVSSERTEPALTGDDVLLVTGGGKGITAECALALAEESGAKLGLLGRSDPADDEELASNLKRMTDAGITTHYARADVTDAEQVREAISQLREAIGPITAVLHGSGRNEPKALAQLDLPEFRETFAPKLDGLHAVLDAVDVDQLRLLIAFGSIIGRAGLRGEGHYATANEWLSDTMETFAAEHPDCRTLCLEWSVWSGVGMGERLSVVESLTRDGITPVTPDQGVRVLRRLLADPDAPTVVVISGRTQGIDTVRYDLPELPLLRFVERPLVRYHGVELVTEVELNTGTDPYLADHLLDGNLLLPAVLGMEAMAQVAAAASGRTTTPVIEEAEFLRPIVIPPDGSVTIQIAAVVSDNDLVDVVIRSSETGYAAEHFQARLRFDEPEIPEGPPEQVGDDLPPCDIAPAEDLYGDVLFQGGRFQRLRRYRRAAAKDVDVEVEAIGSTPWFAGFLPDTLLLGDPGVRDTLMHGNQVCVPDATLLPAGIDRLYPAGDRLSGDQEVRYCATERSHDGDTYIYDIALRNASGELIERWEGLRLQAVRRTDGTGPWVAPLLGPYLQRTVEDLTGAAVAVAVEPDEAEQKPDDSSGNGAAKSDSDKPDDDHVERRRARTALAAGRALGHQVSIRYRPDGAPEIDGDHSVSAAHGGGLTLCVIGTGPIACDVELVAGRNESEWKDLLGPHGELANQVASATGENPDTAATRVWTALECLQKAGRPSRDPLDLRKPERDGWTVFSSGDTRIAVFVTSLRDTAEPVCFAVLNERRR